MAGNNVNYFEPNDYDFNVEDLCVGVKLEVSVPGRPISAKAGGNNISWQTILDDVNLFGGTDGYLSTSYSDISSLDAHSGGNKDSFGIEYINIHYNSWNFPEIDMKLVDVRGNAVMNPLESRRDDNDKAGSFLNALFTFPYPMFRLTVKGYYGKPVTYKLTVRDVRTNFNASNGNFEITVKFIGYMFGYLNDIPMQYLLIAPDINYDGKIHLLGNFSDGNGHVIPTFREFLKGVTDAIEATAKNEDILFLKQKAIEIEGALKIFNDIKSLVDRVNIDLSGPTYHDVFTITKSGDTEFVLNTKETYENGEKISTDAKKNTIDGLKKDVKNIIDNHQKYFNDYDVTDSYRLSEVDELKNKNNSLLNPPKNNNGGDNYVFPLTVYFDYEELKSQVGGRVNELISEKNDNDEQLTSQMGSAYQESLGWNPTIGNIFEMVFAHFKCFYENYYTCIENIKGTSSQRNLKSLSVNTDCKRIGDGNQTVPPYPLITNSNGKYEWVGSVNEMKEKYEENFFVEAIVSGATNTGEELAKTALEYDMQRDFASFPQKGIPTLLSDVYDGGDGNPYAGTSYNTGENGEIPTVMQVFAKRLLLRYVYNGGVYAALPADVFAKLEALNCFREHLNVDELKYIQETHWGEGNINNELIDFIKTFTNATDYSGLSILYKDYVGVKHTSGATNGELKLNNSTFSGDDDEVMEYQTLLFPVYEYLNAHQGNLTDSYRKVFPLTKDIPTRLITPQVENIMSFGTWSLALIKNPDVDYDYDLFVGLKWDLFDSFSWSDAGLDRYYDGDEMLRIFLSKTFGKINNVVGYNLFGINRYEYDDKVDWEGTYELTGVFKCPRIYLAFAHEKQEFNTSYSEGSKWIKFCDSVKKEINSDDELKRIKIKLTDLAKKTPVHTKIKPGLNGSKHYTYTIEYTAEFKRELNKILSETVTLYNLHGVYNGYGGDDSGVPEKIVFGAGEVFTKTLQDLYGKMNETQYSIAEQKKDYASTDKKIAIYMTMKELYDRWKFGTWRPNGNDTIYEQNLMVGLGNFVFLDSHYDDIKQKHFVNFDVFADLVRNIVDTSKEMSVYSFLYEICKAANMTLHALPINVYDYLGGGTNKIQEMFTAYPYMACEDDTAMQTTYVAMYAHKPSEHLNIVDPYNSYADDGIDFTSNATVINSNKPLPVFGVTYGMQKQRFFKNISVGSDNPKTTAHSLMSELLISKQATSGSQNLGFEAHDIFDVYASKSYTCRVEMMGNAMIMPMMYFQLNNIPLFKGGYFIINAEHNISRNGMTTTFTGVRVNKNRFDLLPKNIPDVQTYMGNGSGSGLFDGGNKIGVAEKPAGNFNGSKYSKEETIIILDAGHEMTKEGKESPKFDVFAINSNIKKTCEITENEVIVYHYEDKKNYKKIYMRFISGGDEWGDIVYGFDIENFPSNYNINGNYNVLKIDMCTLYKNGDKYIHTADSVMIPGVGYFYGFYNIATNNLYYYWDGTSWIQCPEQYVADLFNRVDNEFGDILGKKTLRQVYNECMEEFYEPLINTGDTTEKGILRPLSVTKGEEYQANGGLMNQGRTRYREYWGNRKIVDEIKRQLKTRGIPEEHIIIHSTTGRDAPSYDSLHGSTYSSKVNEIYNNNDGNCIMVSVHSNATTGITEENFFEPSKIDGSKYWSIFCQNNDEYIEGKGKRKNFSDGGIPQDDVSWYLADCIRQGMVDVVKSSEWSNNGFNKFIGESHIQKNISIFKKTEGGIRPLTYCKPPTVLSENFFHTNANTVRILGTKKGIELIAKAHVNGIMNFLNG